jgi:hypothetical protein
MGFIFSAFALGILACQLVAALPPCGVPSMAGLALLALLAGLGAPPEWVARHRLLLDQKNNLAIFPQ